MREHTSSSKAQPVDKFFAERNTEHQPALVSDHKAHPKYIRCYNCSAMTLENHVCQYCGRYQE